MAKEIDLIVRLRAKTQELDKRIKRSEARMRGFTRNMDTMSKRIQSSLRNAFAGVAVIAAVTSATQSIAKFEFQMDKVQAVSRATSTQMERLQRNALDLGRISKFTATQIGSLEEELARLGFTPEKIIDSTDAIRKLATVADTELGESAKTLAGVLNSFNLEATESGRVANIMAESFSRSALDLEKFQVSMSNVGATANAAGVNMAKTSALIGSLVDANIDASKAGTDLRKIFTELSLQGLTLEQALGKILNSTDKVRTSYELFGQRAATSSIILAENIDKWKELEKTLSDTNVELDSMVDVVEDNLLTDWKKFVSAIDGVVQKGGALNPILRDTTQWVTNLINALNSDNITLWEKWGALLAAPMTSANLIDHLKKLDEQRQKEKDIQQSIDDKVASQWAAIDARNIYTNSIREGITSVEDMKVAVEDYSNAEQINIELEKIAKAERDKNNESIKAQTLAFERLAVARKKAAIAGAGAGLNVEGISIYQGGLGAESGLTLPTPSIDLEAFDQMLFDLRVKMEMATASIIDPLSEMNDRINGELNAAFANTFVALGEAIGSGNLSEAFGSVQNIIADAISSIGKAMIAYGVAEIALEAAIKTGNGVLAIAAGTALVAAGALLSSERKSGAASLSGGSGGGRSSGPSGFSNTQGQSISFEPIRLELEGRTLVAAIKAEERYNGRG